MMAMEELEADVREYHRIMVEVARAIAMIDRAIGITPEGPLCASIFALMDGYTDALEAMHEINGWLEWWHLECNLGDTPLEAKPVYGVELRMISTIDDLVQLIRESKSGNLPC